MSNAPQTITPIDVIPAPRTPHPLESGPSLDVPSHHLLEVNLRVFDSVSEAAERARRQARGRARGLSVFTCNVDHLMMVSKNEEFRRAYRAADIVTIDGAPLALLSRCTGTAGAKRVTGVDLTVALIELAARDGLKVALVGGASGRGEAAAARLAERFPGLPAMFVDSPRMGFELGDDEDTRLVGALRAYGPDVVVVCLGAPKQELWIDRHRDAIPGAVLVGAGATIDFLSGHQSRAPRIFQRTGTEACYRLATDFRRLWRRYLLRDAGFMIRFPVVVGGYAMARAGITSAVRSHPCVSRDSRSSRRDVRCVACTPAGGPVVLQAELTSG